MRRSFPYNNRVDVRSDVYQNKLFLMTMFCKCHQNTEDEQKLQKCLNVSFFVVMNGKRIETKRKKARKLFKSSFLLANRKKLNF